MGRGLIQLQRRRATGKVIVHEKYTIMASETTEGVVTTPRGFVILYKTKTELLPVKYF